MEETKNLLAPTVERVVSVKDYGVNTVTSVRDYGVNKATAVKDYSVNTVSFICSFVVCLGAKEGTESFAKPDPTRNCTVQHFAQSCARV